MIIKVTNDAQERSISFRIVNRNEEDFSNVEILDTIFGPGDKTIEVRETFTTEEGWS